MSQDNGPADQPGQPRRRWRWWLTGALVLVLAGGLWWVNRPQFAASQSIRDVGVSDAPFYLLDQGMPGELVELRDGVFRPAGSGEDGPHIRVGSDPFYADVDGDGDEDVAVVLEWTGTPGQDYSGWQAVHFWLWDKGKVSPVRWPAAWQWTCVTDDQPDARGLGVKFRTSPFGVVIGRNSNNLCGADIGVPGFGSMFNVAVHDGVPSMDYQGSYAMAVENCFGGGEDPKDTSQLVDVSEVDTPRVVPEASGPVVSGPNPSSIVEADRNLAPTTSYLETHHGFVAVFVTNAALRGCGWVPWDEIRDLLDR